MEGAREASDEALRSSLESGQYSDLTIRCGAHSFRVHKVVVCTRSEFFAAACKPGAFKEGQNGVIDLHAASKDDGGGEEDLSADDPQAVRLMIDFLYHHDYTAPAEDSDEQSDPGNASDSPPNEGSARDDESDQGGASSDDESDEANASANLATRIDRNTVLHVKMYALGAKYLLDSLQSTALHKFNEAAKHGWNDAEFVEAIRLAFTSTPDADRGLRRAVLATILEHKHVLLHRREVERVVRGIRGLTYDLLLGAIQPEPAGFTPSCDVCDAATVAQCHFCHEDFVRCACAELEMDEDVFCWPCRAPC